jgi:hypothetical protein
MLRAVGNGRFSQSSEVHARYVILLYSGGSLLDARYFVSANTKGNSTQPVAWCGLWDEDTDPMGLWDCGTLFLCVDNLLSPGSA